MTKEEAKNILGSVGKQFSDKEIEEIIDKLTALADIFLEQNKEAIVNNNHGKI